MIDRLLSETQEQLKKMSSTRLAAKLGKAGFDPDRLEQLERAELLEAMAETMLAEPSTESETDFVREALEASQVPLPAGDSSSATSKGGALQSVSGSSSWRKNGRSERSARPNERRERLLERQKN